jgi:hypothetical protein
VVLSNHAGETLVTENEDELLTMVLQKARRRFEGSPPQTRYKFQPIERVRVPEDPTAGYSGSDATPRARQTMPTAVADQGYDGSPQGSGEALLPRVEPGPPVDRPRADVPVGVVAIPFVRVRMPDADPATAFPLRSGLGEAAPSRQRAWRAASYETYTQRQTPHRPGVAGQSPLEPSL